MDESQKPVPFADGLDHVCAACRDAIGRIDAVGLTLITGTHARISLAATGRMAQLGERWEFSLGEGPGLQAFRNRLPVLVPDLTDPEQIADWPVFAGEAAEWGLRAVFAYPVLLGPSPVAVLTLYRGGTGALSPAGHRLAELHAGLAATLLGQAGRDLTVIGDCDEVAMLTPQVSVVHQAVGMVMERHGLSADQAMAHLRAMAYTCRRPVDELAADVVQRRISYSIEDMP
ncbi:GAF and ANTAR domain-containing protein [Amycolatopsis japonica]|uniref:GAF and ANTAR domain-containing protein n=1 Tax=Amycolatopsis japonica TaxID=208439 RepID=UPI003324B175